MKKKYLALFLALALTCGLLAGCGASSSAGGNASPASSAPAAAADEWEEPYAENGFADSLSSSADFSAVRENAKLILRADVEAEATDFEATDTALQQLTAQAGGYIESSSVGGSVGYRYASYVLRVPQEKFENFLGQVGDTCHITYTSTGSTDVTDSYYDTEARLATQTTKQERLLALLDKAEEMEDIIALENALADVNYEIESLTGSLRHYDNLVGYATISLNLSEVRDLTAVQETPSFGGELKQAFVGGTHGLVAFAQGLLLVLVGCWPLVVVLVIAAVVVIVVLRRKERARAKAIREAIEQAENKQE